MTKRDAFFSFLNPEHLYSAALFFVVVTAILVSLIYGYLYVKKRNFRITDRINEQVNTWIGEVLMEKELPQILLTPELELYLSRKKNREFVIDNLIRVRKNLRGAAAKSIVDLYERLQLKKDSVARFRSVVWHQKAKGIYELYMMDQEEELLDIYDYTNSDNEFVRMEAQTAIVGFFGYKGLTFLDELEYPLHEWQQLKLLEQLSTLDTVVMENLPRWLRSGNLYVQRFALKLADLYRQMDVHDIVLECLAQQDEKVRFQAIKTLGRIAHENTGTILAEHYAGETYENQKAILQQMKVIADERLVPFLERVLAEGDDALRLESARALAAIRNCVEVLSGYPGDATLSSIFKQVQYEFGK